MATIATVTNQPQGIELSSSPGSLPQSVQYLTGLDTVIVKQKMEAMEVLTGIETRNKYHILNKDFQQIFYAFEESKECERIFCAPTRGFTIHVTDNQNLEIMRFIREFKYCTGCCWCADGCCSMSLSVESPPGRYLGRIAISDSKCANFIKVLDAAETHLYTIWVPHCICQDVCCPDDVIIPITDPSLTQEIGRFAKVWRGCCAEALGDADTFRVEFALGDGDTFRVEFPANMELNNKILMMGALFLVDYLRFETDQK